MEEENKKRLIERIIKEQDLVALYTYNDFNKSLTTKLSKRRRKKKRAI